MSTDTDKLKRVAALQEVAQLTCGIVNKLTDENHGVSADVQFVSRLNGLEKIVDGYFDSVAKFKIAHGFLDSDKISEPKRAALMLKILLEEKVAGFFTVSPEYVDSMYVRLVEAYFCFYAAIYQLEIDASKIEARLFDDLVTCVISAYNDETAVPDAEWLCMAMLALQLSVH